MIEIQNLSSGQEDFFFIKIEEKGINILVDGGKSGTRSNQILKDLSEKKQRIDYIVLTHIDRDHIQGLLKILKSEYKDICEDAIIVYNKFTEGIISYKQAEEFENLIKGHEVIVSYQEYQDNTGGIRFFGVEQRKKLCHTDGIYFTFLSPSRERVEQLYSYYEYYKKNDATKSDNSKIVNRSSIMFILEYKGAAILMTGDGTLSDIIPHINTLSEDRLVQPIKEFQVIKLPHHGSQDRKSVV